MPPSRLFRRKFVMHTKLIALDLDHTTLREDRSLSPANRGALCRALEKGIIVVVASGRAFRTFSKEVMDIPGIRYAISGNGSAQWDAQTDTCLQSFTLPVDQVETILQCIDENIIFEVMIDGRPYCPDFYHDDPVRYGGNPKSRDFTRSTRTPVHDIRRFAMENRDNISWIQSYPKDMERKAAIWQQVEELTQGVRVTSALKGLLEFYNPNASKKGGLEFFCNYLGIDSADAVSFGDAENDREMMQYTGRCVAVGNAIEPLKQMADYVTLNSWDDGVDYAFRNFLGI